MAGAQEEVEAPAIPYCAPSQIMAGPTTLLGSHPICPIQMAIDLTRGAGWGPEELVNWGLVHTELACVPFSGPWLFYWLG